jgi:O-antigen ligase
MPRTYHDHLDTWAKTCLTGIFLAFPISLAFANLLLALTLLFWVFAGRFRMRWESVRHNPVTVPALFIYAMILLGALYSPASMQEIGLHLGKYSKFLFVVVAVSLLQEPVWRGRCWLAFQAAMFITLASTYANVWLDLPWSVTHNQGLGVDHTVFQDHISQGIMMTLFVLIALHKAWLGRTGAMGWFWLTVALLAIGNITHLTGSRTAFLSLMAALLALGFTVVPKRWRVGLAITAVLTAGLLVLSSSRLQQQATRGWSELRADNKAEISSVGARVRMWEISVAHIKEHPLLGTGTGSYHEVMRKALSDDAWCAVACAHPHNQFLFFGVEHGLMGILALIFYFYRPLRYGGGLGLHHQALLAGFMAIFAVDSMTHGPMWLARENFFFSFVLALLVAGLTVPSKLSSELVHPANP